MHTRLIAKPRLWILAGLLLTAVGCVGDPDRFTPKPANSDAAVLGAGGPADVFPALVEAAMREDADAVEAVFVVDRPFMQYRAEAMAAQLVAARRAHNALATLMSEPQATAFLKAQTKVEPGFQVVIVPTGATAEELRAEARAAGDDLNNFGSGAPFVERGGRWFMNLTLPRPYSDEDVEEARLSAAPGDIVNSVTGFAYLDWLTRTIAAGESELAALKVGRFTGSGQASPEARALADRGRKAVRQVIDEAVRRGFHWFDSMGLYEQADQRMSAFVGVARN